MCGRWSSSSLPRRWESRFRIRPPSRTVPVYVKTASEQIRDAVGSWPGVTSVPHRFGGTEYLFGKKEMGHVHGDRLADLPMPRRLHDELIAAGRAQPHHILPETGWISVWIEGQEDIVGVIELFRLQYDRYAKTPTPSSV